MMVVYGAQIGLQYSAGRHVGKEFHKGATFPHAEVGYILP